MLGRAGHDNVPSLCTGTRVLESPVLLPHVLLFQQGAFRYHPGTPGNLDLPNFHQITLGYLLGGQDVTKLEVFFFGGTEVTTGAWIVLPDLLLYCTATKSLPQEQTRLATCLGLVKS